MRLDSHAADLEDLRDRVRTQDWYHDLSEQESDAEIERILARAEGRERIQKTGQMLRTVLPTEIDVDPGITRLSAVP